MGRSVLPFRLPPATQVSWLLYAAVAPRRWISALVVRRYHVRPESVLRPARHEQQGDRPKQGPMRKRGAMTTTIGPTRGLGVEASNKAILTGVGKGLRGVAAANDVQSIAVRHAVLRTKQAIRRNKRTVSSGRRDVRKNESAKVRVIFRTHVGARSEGSLARVEERSPGGARSRIVTPHLSHERASKRNGLSAQHRATIKGARWLAGGGGSPDVHHSCNRRRWCRRRGRGADPS